MKYRMKIILPVYFFVSAILFSLLLPILRGISLFNQIGIVIDMFFAFLSIILFANTYFCEKQLCTAENFYLLPVKRIQSELVERIIIKILFVIILAVITFGLYTMRKPQLLLDESKITIFFESIFAISVSIIFWGILTNFLVILLKHIWLGMAINIVLWFFLSSTLGQKLPVFLNIFSYGSTDSMGNPVSNWYISKIIYLCISIILLLFSLIIVKRSPCE